MAHLVQKYFVKKIIWIKIIWINEEAIPVFISRERELESLKEFYDKDGIGMTVIYGACVKIGLNQEKPYK